MKNLTTPQAILFGLGLIALSISSIPYSTKLVTPAFASNSIKKIAICNPNSNRCATIGNSGRFWVGSTK